MAATQRNVNVRADRNRTANRRSQYYVQGNTVRRADVTEEIRKRPQRKVNNNTIKKNRERAKHMSIGYVMFLCAALVATGMILIYYVGLQSDITNSVKNISKLERELNDLKVANDEEYSRITSSIDLEEIRRVAIQELGMQYATQGQIISFASENNDYVKQMAEIPH